MNNNLKPFRLINDSELKRIHLFFEKNLLLWNEQHALFPLSCDLDRNPIPPQMDKDYVLITEQKKPIALLTHHDLSLIKNCLFGDVSYISHLI